MSLQGKIKRFVSIYDKVSNNRYPSFSELKDYLEDQGLNVSERSLQRDIEHFRVEFGIEIQYDRMRNGYYVDTANSTNADSVIKFFEIVNMANLLTESLKEGRAILNYISFEGQGSMRGIDHLNKLLLAIKSRRRIVFSHESYETGRTKEYKVSPYMMREYMNRWYLVGIIEGMDKFRTFGVDRITGLKLLAETYKHDKKMQPEKNFANIIGLNYNTDSEIEEVELSFTEKQYKYITALPIHPSQYPVEGKPRHVILKIIPNFEFNQRIMMLGDQVKVVRPAWLAKEIKEELKAAVGQYGR